MYRIKLFKNFDERQPIDFSDQTLSSLRYRMERWCATHPDECDGLTIGEPVDGGRYYMLSRSEDTPPEYEWNLEDRVDYDEVESGIFEAMYKNFVQVVINYIAAGYTW